jgi:hypothetical protein
MPSVKKLHTDRRCVTVAANRSWRSETHRGRRPAVWSPGEYLVIHWAEATPGLFLFCAVLVFSLWRFVAFATAQRACTTLALIAGTLGAIRGVPARVLVAGVQRLPGLRAAGQPVLVRPGFLPRQ